MAILSLAGRGQSAKMVLALAMLCGAGCDPHDQGSGHFAEQLRDIQAIDRVKVSGAIDVFIEVDPAAEPSMIVVGDDNLLDRVVDEQSGNRLALEVDGLLMPHHPLEVWLRLPNLRGLDVSGAVRVTAWGIASKRLDVDASGACTVVLAGQVNDLRLEGSGATEVQARALQGGDANVDVSGAGDIGVCVDDALRVDVSGASDVRYFGTPESVEQDVSGAGELRFGGPTCATFTPPVRKVPKDCTCAGGGDDDNNFVDVSMDDGPTDGDDNAWQPTHGSGSGGSGSGGSGSGGSGSGGSGSGGSGSGGSSPSGSSPSGSSPSGSSPSGSSSGGSGPSGSSGGGGHDDSDACPS